MNMAINLDNLNTDSTIVQEQDRVSAGSGPLDSGLYDLNIEVAYLEKSKGGALGVVLRTKTSDGRFFRQTLWVTSADAKGNKNYYEKDGVKNYLPGFSLINSLCLLTVGKEFKEVAAAAELKIIKVYSFDTKKEEPTEVPVLVDLMGKDILAGIVRQTVDKNSKNELTGKYEPTGETRDENEIDKFFRAKDKLTTAEILAQAPEATFVHTWEASMAGVVKDRSTKVAGKAGAPGKAGTTAKPTTSMFAPQA